MGYSAYEKWGLNDGYPHVEGFSWTITPELGWKIDAGRPGGFFIQPCFGMPILLDRGDIFLKASLGLGYAF